MSPGPFLNKSMLKSAGKAPADPELAWNLPWADPNSANHVVPAGPLLASTLPTSTADPDGARANPRNLMGFLDAFKAIAMF
jgi:hypothetical protein